MTGKPLNLEFARQTGARHAGALVLFASLLLAGWIGYEYRERTNTFAGLEYRLHVLQQRSSPAPVARSAASVEHEQSELKTMGQVTARLSLPWDALFNEIEATVDEHVTLLIVEPDAEKGALQVTAEARDLASMLAYGKRLAASARFKDALIQSHQVQAQDPQRPVRFVVAARWMMAPAASDGQ